MVTRRSAKSKGSQFEYNCQHSLSKVFGDRVTRTAERGYQLQYDLRVELSSSEDYLAIECKRQAGFTWNEMVKYIKKLESKCPDAQRCYLLLQANRQPCLVMFKAHSDKEQYIVTTFESHFNTTFEKHKGVRK